MARSPANTPSGDREDKRSKIRSVRTSRDRSRRDIPSPRRKGVQLAARSQRSATLTHNASRRVGDRQLPIRISFVQATDDDPQAPPLARILRGGRGGVVRLKLYLAMLWIAGNAPHDTTFPARAWAELLDLPNPEGKGDRRVRDAIAWLANEEFIRVQRQRGRPATLYLQREDGSGEQYSVPGSEPKDKKTGKFPDEHVYVHLPATFWTSGWAVALSSAGIAILLVMLVLVRGRSEEPFWISPGEARRRFHLSEDTWTKGIRELRELGLLVVGRKPVSEEFGWRRVRNLYTLDLAPLENPPPRRPA